MSVLTQWPQWPAVGLSEVTFEDPEDSHDQHSQNYQTHEWLSLWPVPGGWAGRRDYVDILTDTDGDGTAPTSRSGARAGRTWSDACSIRRQT